MVRKILVVSAFWAVVAGASPARADLAVGAGVSGNFGVGNDAIQLPDAWSMDGALGFRIKLSILELTPELDLTYLRSTGTLTNHDIDWAFWVAAGGRLGLQLGFVVPSVYVHYGLGTLQLASANQITHTKAGPYVEAGGALDFRLADELSLGVQAGYGSVSLSQIEADLEKAQVNRVRAGLRLTLFL
ncbi:MAG: hypothetical protein HY901_17915 [Deltaproteobacteria bacterium]|nr:hypothetical protein [Deltaproteobacteria bacterium]